MHFDKEIRRVNERRQLVWFGDVERMTNNILQKRTLARSPKEKRRVVNQDVAGGMKLIKQLKHEICTQMNVEIKKDYWNLGTERRRWQCKTFVKVVLDSKMYLQFCCFIFY